MLKAGRSPQRSWIAAFAWLPTLPVAAILAGWVAYITPKVRWVGQEFQDVKVASL